MRSQAKRIRLLSLLIAVLAILLNASSALAYDEGSTATITHGWGSKRMDLTLWGIAMADLDGSGGKEMVLMERNRLWIGHREGDKLVPGTIYSWPKHIQALRLYAMDVDGDGREEVIVSAVSYDAPASFILSFNEGQFKPLMTNIGWHLRAIGLGGRNMLIGQRSSLDEFFTGKLYELSFEKGKLVRKETLKLKRWTHIFEFAVLPDDVLVSLKGYAPLKAYEKRGKRWKKFWTSHGRYGGTLRYVVLKTRPPLQDLPEYQVPVGREPQALALHGASSMIASRHAMPLRNIIARREMLRGGWVVGFSKDSALGFNDAFTTKRLPGFIADYCVDVDRATGKKKLFVALQTEPNVFRPSPQSSVLMFDLP